MEQKHLMYVPWTGLGNYNGFRGNRWLKNRIQIFKQFVIPSLQAQTCKDFILWCSWRPEEKNNPHVKALTNYLSTIKEFKTIHTFHGVCFYDDKYEDNVARERLVNNLHYTVGDLHDVVGDSDYVLMTIQPSDDLYDKHAVETLQWMFKNEDHQALGFSKGYITNYWNKEVANYDPTTNPPFYTIKFPTKTFLDPLKHIQYTSLKKDVGKYKAGTALPSHEYVGDCLKYQQIDERGFMVGTHKENISTTWQIPFKGEGVSDEVLKDFGIYDAPVLKIKVPLKKKIYFSLPYKVQRKIRYWLTEKFKFSIRLPKFFRTTWSQEQYWKNRDIDWREAYLLGKDEAGQPNWNHPHRQVLVTFLKKLNWMSLMEVGCGAGANLVQIALRMRDRKFQLGGSDISPEAIAVAQTNGFFKDGSFIVCPNDDILMSDKSADVILSDMSLIYTSKKDISKTLDEFKRVARSWVVLCEFDSDKWWKRLWIKLISGYNVYNYKKLLLDKGFFDIVKYKLRDEDWPGSKGTYQEGLRHIIIAKTPKNII